MDVSSVFIPDGSTLSTDYQERSRLPLEVEGLVNFKYCPLKARDDTTAQGPDPADPHENFYVKKTAHLIPYASSLHRIVNLYRAKGKEGVLFMIAPRRSSRQHAQHVLEVPKDSNLQAVSHR